MQPCDGVGAKLGAGLLALEAEALRADALVRPLVRPRDDEAAVAQAREGRPDQRLDLGRAHLNFRARQGVGVEGPQLQLRAAARGGAGRLLVPGDDEPPAGLDDRRQPPLCPRLPRDVDQKGVAGRLPGRGQHLAPDAAVAEVLPHRDELGAAEAGKGGLVCRGRRGNRDLVHGFSLPRGPAAPSLPARGGPRRTRRRRRGWAETRRWPSTTSFRPAPLTRDRANRPPLPGRNQHAHSGARSRLFPALRPG